MSQEQPSKPGHLRAAEIFGFSKKEQASYRITDERFRQILREEATTIHTLREDENNYGEWLFVTVSRPAPQGRVLVTFYGYGRHWLREQWFTDEWFWYQANPFPQVIEQTASREEAEETLRQRLRRIEPYITANEPSGHARLFAMLADMSDEDDAYTTLQEMGDLEDWLGGEL